jgi:hypothetical protein
MDPQTPNPADPAGLPPAASPSPAAAPPRTPARARRPRMFSRPRTWWTIALGAAVLLSAGGVELLYLDDTSNQATIQSLTIANESLNGRNQNLADQLNKVQANLTATLGELATTQAELAHPNLTIWNVPQQLTGPMELLVGGIPDTFTYHLVASSTGPMWVSILTLEQWAKANECVDYGVAVTHYCMHHSGAVMTWEDVTSVNYDFHLAEGCADYVSVFTAASPVTVTPNVSVTYNPASSATGACA